MELSACIVVYNGADEALRAAQTVLDCTRRHPLTLYLVDNASPDGSGQCLAKAAKDGTLHIREDQKVEVLCRTENGGFGTGHNTVLSLLPVSYTHLDVYKRQIMMRTTAIAALPPVWRCWIWTI